MNSKDLRVYYSREDVQQAILDVSRGREVAGVFGDGRFSSRPNTIGYRKDIEMLVDSGAVAFHGSLEKWVNPMNVGKPGYEKTRTGWDLILDLDCKDTEHGKVAAITLLDALRKHGVKNASIKFTGGTGFHLGIPYGCFPKEVDYADTATQYPGLARRIALYIRDFSRQSFEKALLRKWSVEELAEKTGKPVGGIMSGDGIDPYKVVEVDPVLISPRHLFRLPYSLHEKSGLVSLPLRKGEIEGFTREDAHPGKVRLIRGYLDKYEKEEASMLVTEAIDWAAKQKIEKERKVVREFTLRKAVPLELAPPCIVNILKGLSDGKKRSLLILINYMSSLGWKWEDIEAELPRWNEKNVPPLSETYLRGQIKWHERRKKRMPPPSCSNEGYYENFGVCTPDFTCGGQKKTIRNPVNYALRKIKKKND